MSQERTLETFIASVFSLQTSTGGCSTSAWLTLACSSSPLSSSQCFFVFLYSTQESSLTFITDIQAKVANLQAKLCVSSCREGRLSLSKTSASSSNKLYIWLWIVSKIVSRSSYAWHQETPKPLCLFCLRLGACDLFWV